MNNFTLDSLLRGLRTVESSGNYGATGPWLPRGDRAYGAYQVMGNNIPEWTKDALGQPMTPEQFLANKDAQDAVARHRFGGYLAQSSPQDAVSMWFSGRPLSRAMGASDGYMKAPDYVKKVLANSGPDVGPLAFAPTSGAPLGGPQSAIQAAFGSPGTTPTGIGQQVTVGQPQPSGDDFWSGMGNVGTGLVGLGAAIGSLSANPQVSHTLNGMYREAQSNNRPEWQAVGTEAGQVIERNTRDNSLRFTPIPGYNANDPAEVKTLRAVAGDPNLAAAYKSLHNKDASTLEGQYSPEEVPQLKILADLYQRDKGAVSRMDQTSRAKLFRYLADNNISGGDVAAGQVEQASNLASGRQLGKMATNMDTFAETFKGGADVALQASTAFPRSSWKGWNQVANMAADQIGDPNYKRLAVASQTAAREYAKAINPLGSPTVADFDHAMHLLSAADGPEAYKSALDTMRVEIDRTHSRLRTLKKNFKSEVAGEDQQPQSSDGGVTRLKYDSQGNIIQR